MQNATRPMCWICSALVPASVSTSAAAAGSISAFSRPPGGPWWGSELASQTFWTSFYSRAPEEYREAIRDLTAATQFAISFQWMVTLDWADEDHTAIRLTSDVTSYRENRGQKPYILQPRSYIYEALVPPYKASIEDISDSGAALASRGPIRFGRTGIVGQAILLYWAPYQPMAVPPGDAPAARPEAGSE